MSAALKLALGSLLVGVIVLGLKSLAWRITGSVALLSDALESTVNLTTASDATGSITALDWTADVNGGAAVTLDVGTTTVTYTATDPSGNESTSSFTVTVTDDENPAMGLGVKTPARGKNDEEGFE